MVGAGHADADLAAVDLEQQVGLLALHVVGDLALGLEQLRQLAAVEQLVGEDLGVDRAAAPVALGPDLLAPGRELGRIEGRGSEVDRVAEQKRARRLPLRVVQHVALAADLAEAVERERRVGRPVVGHVGAGQVRVRIRHRAVDGCQVPGRSQVVVPGSRGAASGHKQRQQRERLESDIVAHAS